MQPAPPQAPQPPSATATATATSNVRHVQKQVRRICTLDQNGARQCNDVPANAPLPPSAGAVSALDKFGNALKNGRMDEVQSLLAPEVQIHEGGKIENRTEYLASHAAADSAFLKSLKYEDRQRRATARDGRATVISTDIVTKDRQRYELKGTAQLRKQGEQWLITELHWSSRKL